MCKGGLMRKAVSKDDHTLFFESRTNGDIHCVAYKTGMHMSIEDISKELDVSIVASRNSLKNAIRKIYYKMKNLYKIEPMDIVNSMSMVFNINHVGEYKQFLRLLPKEARRELYEDAKQAA